MNTKNILIFIMLIFISVSSQAQVYHYSGGNITDSAGIITFKKPVRIMNINQDFGYGSSLWNFRLENDEGTIVWRANNDRDLMTYDDDGHIWNLTGTLQVNGVPISAGGGDAYLTNRQTFTKRNIFSDTLKADALSLMEQVRIADWFQVTGDVISNLMFIKGSRTFIGTADNYGFVIKTADTNRLVIDSLGAITINKSLAAGTYIIAADSVRSNILTAGDLYINNIGSGIYWRGYSSFIREELNELLYSSTAHRFATKNWNNDIALLDSANGLNLYYGHYTGNGSGLTSVDAITIKGQDTSKFARTDTLTTENIKGAWTFWNIVRCIGIVTFDVSPIFNSVVNFTNGITTTTLTASSTATFNGDVKNTGWRYQGASSNIDKYFRDTVIRTVCGSTGTTVSVAHGISNTSAIMMFAYQIKDDSSGLVLTPNTTNSSLVGSGLIYYPPYIDATNINLRIAASMVNLDNNTDTIKYFLRVSDYNR